MQTQICIAHGYVNLWVERKANYAMLIPRIYVRIYTQIARNNRTRDKHYKRTFAANSSKLPTSVRAAFNDISAVCVICAALLRVQGPAIDGELGPVQGDCRDDVCTRYRWRNATVDDYSNTNWRNNQQHMAGTLWHSVPRRHVGKYGIAIEKYMPCCNGSPIRPTNVLCIYSVFMGIGRIFCGYGIISKVHRVTTKLVFGIFSTTNHPPPPKHGAWHENMWWCLAFKQTQLLVSPAGGATIELIIAKYGDSWTHHPHIRSLYILYDFANLWDHP